MDVEETYQAAQRLKQHADSLIACLGGLLQAVRRRLSRTEGESSSPRLEPCAVPDNGSNASASHSGNTSNLDPSGSRPSPNCALDLTGGPVSGVESEEELFAIFTNLDAPEPDQPNTGYRLPEDADLPEPRPSGLPDFIWTSPEANTGTVAQIPLSIDMRQAILPSPPWPGDEGSDDFTLPSLDNAANTEDSVATGASGASLGAFNTTVLPPWGRPAQRATLRLRESASDSTGTSFVPGTDCQASLPKLDSCNLLTGEASRTLVARKAVPTRAGMRAVTARSCNARAQTLSSVRPAQVNDASSGSNSVTVTLSDDNSTLIQTDSELDSDASSNLLSPVSGGWRDQVARAEHSVDLDESNASLVPPAGALVLYNQIVHPAHGTRKRLPSDTLPTNRPIKAPANFPSWLSFPSAPQLPPEPMLLRDGNWRECISACAEARKLDVRGILEAFERAPPNLPFEDVLRALQYVCEVASTARLLACKRILNHGCPKDIPALPSSDAPNVETLGLLHGLIEEFDNVGPTVMRFKSLFCLYCYYKCFESAVSSLRDHLKLEKTLHKKNQHQIRKYGKQPIISKEERVRLSRKADDQVRNCLVKHLTGPENDSSTAHKQVNEHLKAGKALWLVLGDLDPHWLLLIALQADENSNLLGKNPTPVLNLMDFNPPITYKKLSEPISSKEYVLSSIY